MKILLSEAFPKDVAKCLKEKTELLKFDFNKRVWFEAPSAELDVVLATIAGRYRATFFSETSLASSELKGVRYFQLLHRGSSLGLSWDDTTRTLNDLSTSPWISTTADWRVRILKRVYVTRPRFKPNAIGTVVEGLGDFFVTNSLVLQFPELGRYSLKDSVVLTKQDEVSSNLFLLSAKDFMPGVYKDMNYEEYELESGGQWRMPSERGLISYDLTEFSSKEELLWTAEPFGSWHGTPALICKRTFQESMVRNKIKGVAFRPVLEVGDFLYKHYVDLWLQVISQVSNTCGHKIK